MCVAAASLASFLAAMTAILIERFHETRFYVYDCSGEQHLTLFVLGKVLMKVSIPAGVIGYCYSVISFALHLDWFFFPYLFPPFILLSEDSFS